MAPLNSQNVRGIVVVGGGGGGVVTNGREAGNNVRL